VQLRDYQQRAVDDVRDAYREGARRVLLTAPCGAGKTVIFSHVCRTAASRGKRVTILVHRQELVDQVAAALTAFAVPHGFIASGYEARHGESVQIASVMTLARRLEQTAAPDLLICDEAHHATAGQWDRIIKAFPHARVLGVTATPCRLSGAGLGDTFDRLIVGPTVSELTAAGHLCPARVFAPPTIDMTGAHTLMGDYVKFEVAAAAEKPTVTGDAIDHYQRLTPGKRAVVFCVSLRHAEAIAAAARMAGITALVIDGGMDRDVRRRVIADFAQGRIQWLVTVDLISEGFDVPAIEVGIFLRPTQSLALWLQQAGRVIRTHPGKDTAWLLDHAGNTTRHGLPSEDRAWELQSTAVRAGARKPALTVRVCPKCFSAQRSGRPTCGNCGARFEIESRRVQSEPGELAEITPEEAAKRRERADIGRAAHGGNRERLQEIARIKGYKPGWVEHRLLAARGRRA